MSIVKIEEEIEKRIVMIFPNGKKIYVDNLVEDSKRLENLKNQWETFFEKWDELRKEHEGKVAIVTKDYKISVLSKQQFEKIYKRCSDYHEIYGNFAIPVDIDSGEYCGLVGHRRH